MIDSGYYAAVVKEEIETDDEKVGRPKIKTITYSISIITFSIITIFIEMVVFLVQLVM